MTQASLGRQLLGATVGALVALAGYEVYVYASPVLYAWVQTPQSRLETVSPEVIRFASTDVGDDRLKRLTARAKEINAALGRPVSVAAENLPEEPAMPPVEDNAVQEVSSEDIAEPVAAAGDVPDAPKAERLPDSGPGMIAVAVALFGAGAGWRKMKK